MNASHRQINRQLKLRTITYNLTVNLDLCLKTDAVKSDDSETISPHDTNICYFEHRNSSIKFIAKPIGQGGYYPCFC